MWPFKKKEKLTFIPAQDIEQVYFNGYSKGLMKSKEAFTELGAHEERERIIKLLDQKHTATEGDKTHNESANCTACEVIALIKGENK